MNFYVPLSDNFISSSRTVQVSDLPFILCLSRSRPILIMTGEITLNRTKVSLSGTNVKPCRVINSVDYEW